MPHQFLNLEELARHLARDRREVEKLVQRGRIPGHKVEGEWRFHPAEITHWLEVELRGYNESELTALEVSQRARAPDEISVRTLLRPDTVEVALDARTKRSAVEGVIEVAGRSWHVWEPAAILDAVLVREEVLSTAFENGVAIPHPRTPLPAALGESLIAFARVQSGIAFGGPKRSLTDVFFLVLARDSRTHLLALARLGRLLQQPGFLDGLRAAPNNPAAYEWICNADRELSKG